MVKVTHFGWILEDLTTKWKAVSMKYRKGTSTDDSGSNGVLLMRTSTVDPEMQRGKNDLTKKKKKTKFQVIFEKL